MHNQLINKNSDVTTNPELPNNNIDNINDDIANSNSVTLRNKDDVTIQTTVTKATLVSEDEEIFDYWQENWWHSKINREFYQSYQNQSSKDVLKGVWTGSSAGCLISWSRGKFIGAQRYRCKEFRRNQIDGDDRKIQRQN